MKKRYLYFFCSILILGIITNCTKEITEDLVVSFRVDFSETTIDAFLETPEAVNFSIRGVTSAGVGDYSIKYDVTQGEGYYLINSERVEENQFVNLPAGSQFTIEYVGTSVGTNTITITIRDDQNREEDIILTYNVRDTAFTFDVVPTTESTYVGGIIDLGIDITEISPSEYDVTYTFGTPDVDVVGSGEILIDGDVLEPDTVRVLQPGNTTWQFEGTTLGTVEILFTATSTFGQSEDITILIEIGETPDFTFTAESPDDSFITNNPVNVNFVLAETIGNSSYSMLYTTSSTGSLTYNGVEYAAGEDIPIQVGESIGTYTGTIMGAHTIEFTVVNSNTIPVENMASVIINYEDPDGNPPVIELIGDTEITINAGDTFTDPGATATDDIDGDITADIIVTGNVDTNTPGQYTLMYSVSDSSNNTVSVTRVVIVVDSDAPTITLNGANPLVITIGNSFTDPGATATDAIDGDLTNDIEVTGTVDVNTLGEYTITYTVTDSSNNTTTATRTVQVVNDGSPVITLNGANPLTINAGEAYTEPGAMATDDVDGDLTASIEVTGTVDTNTPGEYTITYTVTDSSNNATTETRTVNVVDTVDPVITLNGANPLTINAGGTYTEPGATATDNVDGDLTNDIEVTGTVDTNTPGEYTITYTVTDSSNNTATETRTVQVVADDPPVLTLNGANPLTINVGESYSEPGATADDAIDGDLTASIEVTGTVDTNTPGDYTITYTVTDSSNNTATATRTVSVVDTVVPVITLIGASTITLTVGDAFSDPGATANDNVDNDISASIVVGGTYVNTNTAGTFTITYDVTDSSNNPAIQVVRTIIIEEPAPTVTFNRATGVLTAPSGSLVTVTMNSGGSGSGNANIRVGGGAFIGITCWGLQSGTSCLISPDDTDPSDSGAAFTFTMPTGGQISFEGSHNPNDVSNISNGTSFTIEVNGETFTDSMSADNGIPQ